MPIPTNIRFTNRGDIILVFRRCSFVSSLKNNFSFGSTPFPQQEKPSTPRMCRKFLFRLSGHDSKTFPQQDLAPRNSSLGYCWFHVYPIFLQGNDRLEQEARRKLFSSLDQPPNTSYHLSDCSEDKELGNNGGTVSPVGCSCRPLRYAYILRAWGSSVTNSGWDVSPSSQRKNNQKRVAMDGNFAFCFIRSNDILCHQRTSSLFQRRGRRIR